MENNTLKVYTDGGARGNPGPAASAFVVEKDNKEIYSASKYLGATTNNIAEYNGVLMAVEWIKNYISKNQCLGINFFLDSELVVKQIKGVYKVKDEKLKTLFLKAIKEMELIKIPINFYHIPRVKNKRADFLVNQELDSQN